MAGVGVTVAAPPASRGTTRIITRESTNQAAIRPRIDQLSPGHDRLSPPFSKTPSPSTAQNAPKLESRIPTPYLSVFSGTCASGLCAIAPAPKPTPKLKPPDADRKARDTAAAHRAQEEANLLRRLAVCDRVKQIALELGDSRLETEAIRMEQKALEVYRQRTQATPEEKPESAEEGDQR